MAPKTQLSRTQGSSAASRRPAKSYFTTAYETLTSPDNASVVRSVVAFGAAVAFFSSSYSEFLLPPL